MEEFVQFALNSLEVFALKSLVFGREFLHPAEVYPQLDEEFPLIDGEFLDRFGQFPAIDKNFHPLDEELGFVAQAG